MPTRRLLPLQAVLLTAALLVTGCGGTEGKKKDEPSPSQVMAEAKKKFDEASSVHIALATKSVPSEGNGVLGATGDINHDPAFQGDVKVLLSTVPATVPVTATGGKVYAKLPFATKYAEIDPSEYGAPDPTDFADPDEGLSSLLTQIDGLTKGKETHKGDQILTSYTGTLPGTAVKKIIPSADAGATYDTTVGVDDEGYARTVKITGP